ncbi:hypothetical protein PIIN_05789 [Serendipita indica DSM 11827]|uniref:DUF6535 domain-containing protein n=1 Tax=Serendipita indica (strain DSM 11827) TaxID=1109443 RepID=G4TKL6_SERID|nr:hypothetical protein PIIN_05789 [Serendipita indica DSM 11827]
MNSSYNTQNPASSKKQLESDVGATGANQTELELDRAQNRVSIFNPNYRPPDPYIVYNEKAATTDADFLSDCYESMDTLLVYAGLLSAVTAALIVETYKDLKAEPLGRTEQVLEAILRHIENPAVRTFVPSSHFKPATHDVVTNMMFFLSLSFSLLAGLGAILVKQWTRRAYRGLNVIVVPRQKAREHYRRVEGIKRWGLPEIIDAIPMLLQLSLFLYFIGICFWLGFLHLTIFIVISTVLTIALGFYLGAAYIPARWPDAPFKSPTSSLVEWCIVRIKSLVSRAEFRVSDDEEMSTYIVIGAPPVLATPMGRVGEFGDESNIDRRDSLDFKILLDILNHPDTSKGIDGVVDDIRLAFTQRDTEVFHPIVDDELIPTVIAKARDSILSCLELRNHRTVFNENEVEKCVLNLQFFEVVLQRHDFNSPEDQMILNDVYEVVDLFLDRAMEARLLDEIILAASVAFRIRLALGKRFDCDQIQRIIILLRDLGPAPRHWEDRGLPNDDFLPEWMFKEYARYQDRIGAVTLAILEHIRASWVQKTPSHTEEVALKEIGRQLEGLLEVGRYKGDRAPDSYPVLREAMSGLWMRSQGMPIALCNWMAVQMNTTGIRVQREDNGLHSVVYLFEDEVEHIEG